jgi:hypothetical protein
MKKLHSKCKAGEPCKRCAKLIKDFQEKVGTIATNIPPHMRAPGSKGSTQR